MADPYCMTHRRRCYTAAHDYTPDRHSYAPAGAARISEADVAALSAAGIRTTGIEVLAAYRAAGGRAAGTWGLDRLVAAGLMEVHPEWSGCYRVTPAGWDAVYAHDAVTDEEQAGLDAAADAYGWGQ